MMNPNMNRRSVQYRQERPPVPPQPAQQLSNQPPCQSCQPSQQTDLQSSCQSCQPSAQMRPGTCQNGGMMAAPDRQTLMNEIYQLGFAIVETVLYLDTHPSDADALNYYNQIKKRYSHVMEMYSREYGPLLNTNVMNDNYWSWVATPMPWEVEGC